MFDKQKQKELYVFQIDRNYSSFYKNILFIFEELRDDDQISNDQYQRFRKRILDLGNDSSRQLKDYSEIFFR
jgi:hypothetical protein